MGRDDEGAVHLIEAVMAAAMVLAVLYYMGSMMPASSEGRTSGLETLSSDLISVLEFRGNSLEHPSLGFTLSSADRWNDSSDELYADADRMLPAGTYCYIDTPYGDIGRRPASGSNICVKPFMASGDGGTMLDCKLILWRA